MTTFISRDARQARTNLDAFIGKYRQLGAWGLGKHPFEEDAWPQKGIAPKGADSGYYYFVRPGYNAKNHRTKKNKPSSIPEKFCMPPKFRDFAKALIAHRHLTHPVTSIITHMRALSHLLAAMERISGSLDPDPTRIGVTELETACELMREEELGEVTRAQRGSALALLWNEMVELELVQEPAVWSNPFPHVGTGDAFRLGAEFEAIRQKRLPNPRALEAGAAMFHRDDLSVRGAFVSSYIALALCAPERNVEFRYAPADLLDTWVDPETGEVGVTLRWFPAKRGTPQTKNVDIQMSQVARRALQRLYQLSAPARALARWYEDNPTRMYLPSHLECLRAKPVIDINEAHACLFGGEVRKLDTRKNETGKVLNFLKKNHVPYTPGCGGPTDYAYPTTLAFADLERAILRQLPDGFPIMDPKTGLKYSQALCLLRKQEFADGFDGLMPAILHPVGPTMISTALGSSKKTRSIFAQYGYTDPNGEPLKLNSHQLRHYLNTIVRRNSGGASKLTEEEIALWSGRKSVRQNRVYNHQSASDELHELEQRLGFHSDTKPFGDISKRIFIKRNQFGQIEKITAHLTDIGYCLHDYMQSPCPIAANCIQCSESVCIKGDERSRNALGLLYADSQALTQAAQQDAEAGMNGADNWFKAHLEREALLKNLLVILDNPDLPDGTPIILNVQTPNRIKEIMARRTIPAKQVVTKIQSLTDVTRLLSAPLGNDEKDIYDAA